jgi:maltokinase
MGVKGFDQTARWFAGKGRAIADVSAIGGAGGLGLHEVRYRDGGRERYLDVADDLAWPPLLDRLRREGPIAGDGGRLELRAGPAFGDLVAAPGPAHVPATDQSNSLVVFGDRLLVKAYRRVEPGPHPEIEILTALAGSDAPVPAFGGSVHWVDDAAADTAIALLQAFVPGVEDGWEGPMARVGAALRAGPPHPMAEWETAGATTAALHLALARAFPPGPGVRADLDRRRDEAVAALEDIGRTDSGVAAIIPAARERLAVLDRLAPPPVTRIHGDLHVAQMLRAGGGAVRVIDFEGDPIRPLADRRRPATPLYDLACLLRSLDHIGSAATKAGDDPAPDAWIAEACAATTAAYEAGIGEPLDRELLAALELVKECTEFVYAARFLPGWTYAPRNGMRRLLERPLAIG